VIEVAVAVAVVTAAAGSFPALDTVAQRPELPESELVEPFHSRL
jgi:hypothetical protein